MFRMPTVAVLKEELLLALGKRYSDEEFRNLCFTFGVELDAVVCVCVCIDIFLFYTSSCCM